MNTVRDPGVSKLIQQLQALSSITEDDLRRWYTLSLSQSLSQSLATEFMASGWEKQDFRIWIRLQYLSALTHMFSR